MILITADLTALLAWRRFIDDSGQQGVNCAIFRNEGVMRSSTLILAAEQLAWQRWPNTRLYTYVNPARIKSPNPGYCFKCAGWSTAGRTQSNLLVLEKYPDGFWSAS